MIRQATVKDVGELVKLGEHAHAKGPFSGLDCDETALRRTALLAITMPNMCCLVSDKDGVNGVIVGVLAPNIWGNMVATDMGIFMREHGDGANLIRAFHQWGKDNGAEMIAMSNTYGNTRYNLLLEKLGMRSTGNQYIGVST